MVSLQKYSTWAQAIFLTLTLSGLAITLLISIFLFFSTWKDLPQSVTQLETAISTLDTTVKSLTEARDVQIIDVLGGEIAVLTKEVEAGEVIWIVFHARANIGCERNVRVAFFSEKTRALHPEVRSDEAVKSAVSKDYQLISLPIKTFESMPPGNYRYAAQLDPINCGVYGTQVLPLSESFTVLPPAKKNDLQLD